MIPIFEQGSGKGIGHTIETFKKRFLEICLEKINDNSCSLFIFIFYDFMEESGPLRKILKSSDGFTQLDRVAGEHLHVFYFHADNEDYSFIARSNAHFMNLLDISDTPLPCLTFFLLGKDSNNELTFIKYIEPFENTDMVTSFHTLITRLKEANQILSSNINCMEHEGAGDDIIENNSKSNFLSSILNSGFRELVSYSWQSFYQHIAKHLNT